MKGTDMNHTTTELEKLASLPLVQDAIRAQAEAVEAESLAARLPILDAHQQTADALADLNSKAADLDAMQDELDRQRDELARQRAAHAIELQQAGTRHRAHTRELRDKHGSGLAVAIGRMLTVQADALRREAEYWRTVRDCSTHWTGVKHETPSPEAVRKADEFDRRAEQIENERDAILALEFARVSPQAIERDIQARVKRLGFNLNTTAEQSGWRIDGWEAKPKTRAAR
jgi:hypothetical protein